MTLPITRDAIWPCVFGAGVETGGYTEVHFNHEAGADWDTPGPALVEFLDDDYQPEEHKIVDLDDIWAAYQKACELGLRDMCMGTLLSEVSEENFDVCCADTVLQIAVMGKIVYA